MAAKKIRITNPDIISKRGGVKVGHIGKVFSMSSDHCTAHNPEWRGNLTERGVKVKILSRQEFEVIN